MLDGVPQQQQQQLGQVGLGGPIVASGVLAFRLGGFALGDVPRRPKAMATPTALARRSAASKRGDTGEFRAGRLTGRQAAGCSR